VKTIAPKGFYSIQSKQRITEDCLAARTNKRVDITCWVPVNIKASNHYRHKQAVAICVNYRSFPALTGFFKDTGMDFNEDLWSLSEMIQVIWRSRIREGKPIHLYVPSERMRGLLKAWLDQ
jgi:hypothetical protein